MTLSLFLTAVAAGVVYVVTPGPATLAVLGLSATHGRRRGLAFFLGHGVGDVTWSALALAALLGASRLGPELFHLLGLICGLYLVHLGLRALRGGGGSADATVIGAERPIRTGMIFGLTNPKAYPFSLAMYGALSVGAGPSLTLADAGLLFAATTLGMAIGDGLTVAWTGLPAVGRAFLRFRGPISRAIGLIFVAFGLRTAWDAAAGLHRS
ncbi:LysE family translocator [Siculibacillus lacustris]|uniref:LysE family translocator n=1 Tax=Siculibacillus lacustris TaxID=1549641 RepID=A0A4Q9VNL6_9HYPH|nr:LysE family transporter [Siculibacillus lacustris]TBW37024.1 LysE family translocator [Siculibacillus lacustris]